MHAPLSVRASHDRPFKLHAESLVRCLPCVQMLASGDAETNLNITTLENPVEEVTTWASVPHWGITQLLECFFSNYCFMM